LRRDNDARFSTLVHCTHLAAELMEYRRTTQGMTQAKRVRTLLCQRHRLLTSHQPLIRIAKYPQRPSGVDVANHASILPIEERRGTMLRGVVQGNPLRKVCLCRGERAHPEQRHASCTVRCYQHARVLHLLCQGQELLA